jgi:PAS domain S-box-containing protein
MPSGEIAFWANTANPIRDASGEIVACLEIARNITERKQAEEALVGAKEHWENTFDAITDMVMLLDNEHRIVRTNRSTSEAFNTTEERLVGKKCYEVVHGQSQPVEKCPLNTTTQTRKPSSREVTVPRIGRTCICSTSPIVDHEGNLTGYTHSLKDITESKRLEAQLLQAQKMEAIGTLAGGIAHDFNNLLMGVQGNVSLMLMDMDTTHPYYEQLRNVERQIQSGARLTSHLLGYARKGRYDVKALDLNQLVEDVSGTFGRTRKEITIYREFAKDLSAIEVDPGQIEQVLFNLFVNAADAMPGGGNLILKTMNVTHKDMKGKLYDPKPGNYVLLTVTDTGTGIYKKDMERIFDPFFTTKERDRGTGLGLASAYGIIKAHGGYIDVASKRGHETTFSIYLPASRKKAPKVVKAAKGVLRGTETVLLVDDEEVVLGVGQELLESMGYRVLTARDGKEAIKVYKKNRDNIDIVLLDIVMPNMGGSEAYDRIKEIRPNVKVLLLSGFSIDGEAIEILERGCNGFIQKPFTMKELSGRIREILDKE